MRQPAPPLYPTALAAVAAGMAIPAAYAALTGDERTARTFFYTGVFCAFVAGALGLALAGRSRLPQAEGELLTLLVGWLTLPAFAALPVVSVTPSIGWSGAWFEMVAAFTTTGGTGYDDPATLPPAIHLWRAVVAWLGGLMTLTAAYVILAPRRLGGFEVAAAPRHDRRGQVVDINLVELAGETVPVQDRVERALRNILPVYGGLTTVLAVLFAAAGESTLRGVIHAVGIISTSGITPLPNGFASVGNLWVEIGAAAFLALSATRRLYAGASQFGRREPIRRDAEIWLMAALVAATTVALFVRHWFGALSIDGAGAVEQGLDAASAFWGAAFTALSFLTTTGYESAHWQTARAWSGLENPALILLGLCAIGGGVATTAGGIKLIRAYTLLRHGMREIDRLAQPTAILGLGPAVRELVRDGAFVAWAFIMLYVATIFVIALALALLGLEFQTALIAAIAGVTNTGPAFGAVAAQHESFALLDGMQRAVLAIGMVFGRIETLAVIAIFSPDAWRGFLRQAKSSGNHVRERTRLRM